MCSRRVTYHHAHADCSRPLCCSEITPEGKRVTKLDQILLNGNNVALVCGHTLSLPAGEPAPIDPPCALAVGAGRQPKLRLGFGAVCGARDREEVLRLSPRSGLDALLDRILESDIDAVQPPQAP